MNCLIRALVALALALPAWPVLAVNPDRSLAELHHASWTREQGAPGPVLSLIQRPDGFLWLGGPRGLYRFDGVSFEQVRQLGGVDVSAWSVNSMRTMRDGSAWISFGVATGGGYYRDGKLTVYDVKSGLGGVQDILEDADGNAWFAAANGTLSRVAAHSGQPGAPELIDARWNVGERQLARRMALDNQGTLWLSVRGNTPDPAGDLLFLKRGEKRFEQAPHGVGHHITTARDGSLWGTTATTGLIERRAGEAAVRRVATEPAGTLAFDSHGVLWIQTAKGIARVREPRAVNAAATLGTDLFVPAQGLSSAVIYAALEDREGNFWLATAAGLDRFRDNKLTPVALPRRQQQLSVVPGDNGAVWAANWDPGLLHVTADGYQDHPEVPYSTTYLYRDAHDAIWAGNTLGLWHKNGTGPAQHIKVPPELVSDAVRAVTHDAQGQLWLAPRASGLRYLKDGAWHATSAEHGFPAKWTASFLFTDARGRTWVDHDEEVLLIERGVARPMGARALGLDIGLLNALYHRDGRIWLLGARGLALFDGERFKTLRNPGSRDLHKLSGMVETEDGDLWLNSPDGLLRVARDEVERGLGDPTTPLAIDRLSTADGHRGSTLAGGPGPTMAQASDGRVWVATDGGLAWIDPKRMARNTVKPTVMIRSVRFDGVETALTDTVAPPLVRQLEFGYTAASLTMPERVSFRYRLEGVDSEWQEAGTRRTAFYTGLPPGRYRLEVMASNGDGLWSERPAAFDFHVAPAWFETWWFRAAAVLLLAALLWAAHRMRLRQVAARSRQREQLRQMERTRIARDLHDTLLQGVNGLILRFQAVADALPRDGEMHGRVTTALNRADGVLQEGRDCVNNLREAVHGSLPFELALAEEFTELAKQGPTRFELKTEGTPRELHPTVEENLRRLAHEALSNALRHAGATYVLLEVNYGWRELHLRIMDNGSGIDAQ